MIFPQFLEDLHEKEYQGTLTYEEWIEQLPATEWIGYGDKFADLEREMASVDLTDLEQDYETTGH
jgi:hypothetical protein